MLKQKSVNKNHASLMDLLGKDRVRLNEPMSLHTTYKIGGPADLFFQARTQDDITLAIGLARELGIPFFLFGLGANILVSDLGIRGLVIKNRSCNVEIGPNNRLAATSGTSMDDIIRITQKESLTGMEHFIGIPSTVGGAIWQNLHFLNPERSRILFIGDLLEEATILKEEGEITDVTRDYFEFGYDDCILHKRRDIVLRAIFSLEPADPIKIGATMEANLLWRGEHHPNLELFPSAGSVFKRIGEVGAGKLIDQCGLKGKIMGAAQISPLHANFIVNLGGAKAQDILALIDLAKHEVYERFHVELKEEIGVIGEFSK